MEVKCTDSVHVKKIFMRSSVCRQRCENHDVNLHNQNINIIHISIQPHFQITPCQRSLPLSWHQALYKHKIIPFYQFNSMVGTNPAHQVQCSANIPKYVSYPVVCVCFVVSVSMTCLFFTWWQNNMHIIQSSSNILFLGPREVFGSFNHNCRHTTTTYYIHT